MSVLLGHDLLSRFAFDWPSGSQVETISSSFFDPVGLLLCLCSLVVVRVAVGFPVLGFQGVTDRTLGFVQLRQRILRVADVGRNTLGCEWNCQRGSDR